MERIGERIRSAREALGLSREQLGRAVGMSRQSVRLWENGEIRSPRAETLLRLARRLRKDPEWIINGGNRGEEGCNELDALAIHFQRLSPDTRQAILELVKSWPSTT